MGENGPLIDLWSSPRPEALRADWKIPDGIMMGLASQSQEKIDKVGGILQQHGGQLIASSPAPEEGIADLIQMLGTISGRTLNIKTAVAFADLRARKILAIEQVCIILKLRPFGIEEYLDTIGAALVGHIPGAIDFADQKATGFLDSGFTLRVGRMIACSENDSKKLVWVDPKVASVVLGDYFRGSPSPLINWVIYNGLRTKYYPSFPLWVP